MQGHLQPSERSGYHTPPCDSRPAKAGIQTERYHLISLAEQARVEVVNFQIVVGPSLPNAFLAFCQAAPEAPSGRNPFDEASNGTVVSLNQREITTELIDACRRGEREAFRALYDANKDKVYSICLYYFHGEPAAAADATQQVFLKLITHIWQFRGTADFSTWLYRLVANTCLDSARRARARAARRDSRPLWCVVRQNPSFWLR